MNTFANALVCLVLLLSTLTVNVAESQQGTIIYESKTITQKKGQSLTEVFKKAGLSDYQIKLFLSSTMNKEAVSDRTFRLIYEIQDKKTLLREARVSRGKNHVNFIVTGKVGQHRLVSGPTKIPNKQIRKNIRVINSKSKTQKKTTNKKLVQLTAIDPLLSSVSFIQKQGQSLEKAWHSVGLSSYQQKILKKGDYRKQAISNRRFTLYFSGKGSQRRLVGAIIIRGKSQVEYIVKGEAGGHKLVNLKTVSSKERTETLRRFSRAKRLKTKKVAVKLESTKKSTKSIRSGNYQVIRIRQKKGQSLASAMRSARLSNIQRKLIADIPVTTSAKSTRYFNLLFEKKGKSKYLKAARVTRAGRAAEFALVKYKGKWRWANSRGQVNIGGKSSGGFKRIPLNYRRVSSHFNLRRRHPITRRIRPHKGTDFAARHGTPIYAPYPGVVKFAGRQRGYGIVLEINHQNGYRTKYAHLSRISRGLRPGKRVRKGQLIARVGNTGLSTGAHLHYEVIVNGRHRNPLTVKLPGGRRSSGTKTTTAAKLAVRKYLPILRKYAK